MKKTEEEEEEEKRSHQKNLHKFSLFCEARPDCHYIVKVEDDGGRTNKATEEN